MSVFLDHFHWFGCFCPSLSHLGLSWFIYFFRKTHENTPHPHRISRTHITVRIKLSNWWFLGYFLDNHKWLLQVVSVAFSPEGASFDDEQLVIKAIKERFGFLHGGYDDQELIRGCVWTRFDCVSSFFYSSTYQCAWFHCHIYIYIHRLRILYEHL